MNVHHAKFQKSLIVEQFQGNYLNNSSPDKPSIFQDLVCFISLCPRVFWFLITTRRSEIFYREEKTFFICPFASDGKIDD